MDRLIIMMTKTFKKISCPWDMCPKTGWDVKWSNCVDDKWEGPSEGRFSRFPRSLKKFVCGGVGCILQSMKFDRELLFAIERELVVKRKKKEANTSEGEWLFPGNETNLSRGVLVPGPTPIKVVERSYDGFAGAWGNSERSSPERNKSRCPKVVSCGAKWKWAPFATSLYGHKMCCVESDSQMAQVVPTQTVLVWPRDDWVSAFDLLKWLEWNSCG